VAAGSLQARPDAAAPAAGEVDAAPRRWLQPGQTPPSDSDVLRDTMKLVPKLRRSETTHYVILSDTTPEDVSMIGSMLEATVQKFAEVSDALDWSPKPLRHKLVAVVFRDQGDYADFAAACDKVNKSWAVGYYSPVADRLVLYKSDNGADVRKAIKQLDDESRRLQEAEQRQGGQGMALHTNRDFGHAKRQLSAEHARIRDVATGSFVSTAVHEAAHQLLFHTDVQRRGVAYPLWLAEGLATNFETERIDVRFGYQQDNWRRRDSFKSALDKDSVVPFEVLLTQDRLTDGTDNAEAIGNFYAQAYALTNWMMRERPTELRLYLDSLRDGSYANPHTRKEKFEAIYGPMARVERNWVRYEGARQRDILFTPYSKRVLATPTRAPVQPAPTGEGAESDAATGMAATPATETPKQVKTPAVRSSASE
jgi:hypothetical protein